MSTQPKTFWLVSAPPQNKEKVIDRVRQSLGNLATVHGFNLPDLKVGTLDALMSLSDDLSRFDTFAESITKKIANQLFSLTDLKDHAHVLSINGASPETYLCNFKWDEAKYPSKAQCRELTETINSQLSKLDEELRAKVNDFSSIVHSLAQSERGQTGNLVARDLSDVIKPDDWFESEYLTTLYVVVPKYGLKDWDSSYETLAEHVLPRSSKVILEEGDSVLVSVILFKRSVDDFKNHGREKRFQVRDFKYNQEAIASGKEEKKKLLTAKEQQKNKLVIWCKTNFAEAFIGLTHLRAIRVFVESILRFGLPINFQALVIQPFKKDDKKTRTYLNETFKYLSSKLTEGGTEEEGQDAFYSYVSFTVNLEYKN